MYLGPKLVDAGAARPAGLPHRCFYCGHGMGEEHASECVIPTRTVVVEYRLTMIRRVPSHWSAHDIEFHMNDSSWCASNFLDDIPEDVCLCPNFAGVYLREATKSDHQDLEMHAPNTPRTAPDITAEDGPKSAKICLIWLFP